MAPKVTSSKLRWISPADRSRSHTRRRISRRRGVSRARRIAFTIHIVVHTKMRIHAFFGDESRVATASRGRARSEGDRCDARGVGHGSQVPDPRFQNSERPHHKQERPHPVSRLRAPFAVMETMRTIAVSYRPSWPSSSRPSSPPSHPRCSRVPSASASCRPCSPSCRSARRDRPCRDRGGSRARSSRRG